VSFPELRFFYIVLLILAPFFSGSKFKFPLTEEELFSESGVKFTKVLPGCDYIAILKPAYRGADTRVLYTLSQKKIMSAYSTHRRHTNSSLHA